MVYLSSWILWSLDSPADFASTALLVEDVDKLTLAQPLTITTPHLLEGAHKIRWITNAHLTHYQVLILNLSHIGFLPSTSLNLVTLHPNPHSDIIHDCTEILQQVYGI